MSKPQKHFSDRMVTSNSPIGPKRAQNDPKKEKDQRVKNQKSLKNEIYQSICLN